MILDVDNLGARTLAVTYRCDRCCSFGTFVPRPGKSGISLPRLWVRHGRETLCPSCGVKAKRLEEYREEVKRREQRHREVCLGMAPAARKPA